MTIIDGGGLQYRQHRFANCPAEMRLFAQWVVWKYVERSGDKPTKVLFSPKHGLSASVTNPQSWATYYEAVATYERGGYDGIGFVLTERDPYCFIDLDDTSKFSNFAELFDRQDRIYRAFQSYAELSPSGAGLHIITKGSVEGGRKRAQIEIYSTLRYMTMTGNVYRDAPIFDETVLCRALWHELGGNTSDDSGFNAPQSQPDADIIRRALNSASGSKFHALHTGRWREYYQSQSEADFAYIDMLAFWSRNREQIARLFLASPLGARTKANRVDYRNRMIGRSFDRLPPPVDIEAIQAMLVEAIAAKLLGGSQ